jgi:integrase
MKWKNTLKVGEHITARQNESGIWYLTHPDNKGERTTYSTGVKGKPAEVKKWIKDSKIQEIVEVGMRTQLTQTVINRMTNRRQTWAAVIPEYEKHLEILGRSPRTISRNIEYLQRFIRDMKLERKAPHNVTVETVYEWINFKVTCKLGSRQVMLQALRSTWNFLVSMGYVDKNVADHTGIRRDALTHSQKETKVIEAFNKTEFKRLVSALEREIEDLDHRCFGYILLKKRKPRKRYSASLESKLSRMRFFYSAVHLAFGIGLRRSDCALLQWDSIHSMKGWLVVHTEKTNARVAIPYEDKTIKEFLKEVPKEEREVVREGLEDAQYYIRKGISSIDQGSEIDLDFCFPEWAKEYLKNPAKISVYFKRFLDENGMNGKSFHSLRHSRVRIWKKMGLSLDQIGRFVGHGSTKTTEGYLG